MIIRDRWTMLKETIRPRLVQHPLLNKNIVATTVIKSLKLKNIQRVFKGNPNVLVIITRAQIIKIPLDEFSLQRCQNNKQILNELKSTSIASFVPKFLEEGTFNDRKYFIESKLPGRAIDVPIGKMEYMVEKAADFITQFHKETAKEIVIDDNAFNKLVSCDLEFLCSYLSPEYSTKLTQIESNLKVQLIGKKLKTVWLHGDYKIENVLFDTKKWEITGIIDWDLSGEAGLPLLDILYLLIYKNALIERQSVIQMLKLKYLSLQFKEQEGKIIQKYLRALNLSDDEIIPLLKLFWIHHIVKRYNQQLISTKNGHFWITENIYNVIDIL